MESFITEQSSGGHERNSRLRRLESSLLEHKPTSANGRRDAINVGVRCATNVIKNRGNWCVICGEDMGITNPRQLCRKTYCENQDNGDECDSGNESDNSLFLNVAKKPKKNED